MLGNQGQAAAAVQFLAPGEKANTAAATSGWIDVSRYEGDLVFIVAIGAVTAGDITPTLEDADDGSGTNNAGVTPNEGAMTVVTTSNDPLMQKVTVNASAVRTHMRFVGTIDTGPVDVSVTMLAHPGHVGS